MYISVLFMHIFGVFKTKCVYLCPMSIMMSNMGGFLEVVRVLQTVGSQIRVLGLRKWSD